MFLLGIDQDLDAFDWRGFGFLDFDWCARVFDVRENSLALILTPVVTIDELPESPLAARDILCGSEQGAIAPES